MSSQMGEQPLLRETVIGYTGVNLILEVAKLVEVEQHGEAARRRSAADGLLMLSASTTSPAPQSSAEANVSIQLETTIHHSAHQEVSSSIALAYFTPINPCRSPVASPSLLRRPAKKVKANHDDVVGPATARGATTESAINQAVTTHTMVPQVATAQDTIGQAMQSNNAARVPCPCKGCDSKRSVSKTTRDDHLAAQRIEEATDRRERKGDDRCGLCSRRNRPECITSARVGLPGCAFCKRTKEKCPFIPENPKRPRKAKATPSSSNT